MTALLNCRECIVRLCSPKDCPGEMKCSRVIHPEEVVREKAEFVLTTVFSRKTDALKRLDRTRR
jgi:hypothetical protein